MVWLVKVGYLKVWYFCTKKKESSRPTTIYKKKICQRNLYKHKKLFIALASSFYLRKWNIHLRYLKDILMKRNQDIL